MHICCLIQRARNLYKKVLKKLKYNGYISNYSENPFRLDCDFNLHGERHYEIPSSEMIKGTFQK